MSLLKPLPYPCEYAWQPPEPEEPPVQKREVLTLEGEMTVTCDPDTAHNQFLIIEDWSSMFSFSVVEAQSIYDLLHKYFGEPAELDSRAFDAEHQAVGGDREASDE